MIIVGRALELEEMPKICLDCPFFDNVFDHCIFAHVLDDVFEELEEKNDFFFELEKLDSCPLVEIEYVFDDKPINNPKCSLEVKG